MSALSYDKIFSSFAVKDIEKAYDFYKNVLALNVTKEDMGMLGIHPEGTTAGIMVYPKPDHTPATYTVLNLGVSNVEAAVDALAAKGVQFERYNTGDIQTDGKGIMRGNGPVIAWFKDPSGNIFSVLEDQ